MAKVELKQPVVDAIAEEIKDAQSVVLVDYRGLTVAQDTELRKQLREAGIVYKVYKNTMMKRIICNFAKTADKLELKGGVVEGNVYDVAGLTELSKIPSREVLLSRLLGSMQSPITNFARVLKQIAEKDGSGDAAEEA